MSLLIVFGIGVLALGIAGGWVLHALWADRASTAGNGQAVDPFRLIARESGDVSFSSDCGADEISWYGDLGHAFLGYEPGEYRPSPAQLREMMHPSDLDLLRSRFDGILNHRRRISAELRLREKSGTYHWVHLTAVPLEPDNPDNPIVVGVLRDTQALHEEREKLAEARRMQTVGTMARGIAHEFNNHLTPIRGFIELALEELGPDHPAFDGLEIAMQRVEYCSQLVSQIQSYGRTSLLKREEVDLDKLLRSVIRVALSSDPDKSNNVSVKREWSLPLPRVRVDASQMQQALLHLIENALNAMPEGGTLTLKVDPEGTGKDQHGRRALDTLCIHVIDSGIGISPENLEHIFDPFFTTQASPGARGMGLSMVQGMVAQHDGWLEIRSEPGEGTEVRLFLPLPEQESKTARAVRDEDDTMSVMPAAPIGRILIADDEEPIRRLIAKIFSDEDWKVQTAQDYYEVLRRIQEEEERYSVVILDMVMPGPPPETCAGIIREKLPDAHILFVSGYTRDQRIEDLQQKTGAGFLSKPFSPKALLEAVDSLTAVEPAAS